MRKYLSIALCTIAALAYGPLGAAADPNATIDPVKGAASNADAKGDANPGAPTASDNARPEKRSSDAAGATQDSSQKPPRPKKNDRIGKDKDWNGASGATSGERRY